MSGQVLWTSGEVPDKSHPSEPRAMSGPSDCPASGEKGPCWVLPVPSPSLQRALGPSQSQRGRGRILESVHWLGLRPDSASHRLLGDTDLWMLSMVVSSGVKL